MTRNVTQSFRISSEGRFSDEVDLIFLRISHASISTVRVVNDTKDFILGGTTSIGFRYRNSQR
jgi:hypothetical protein